MDPILPKLTQDMIQSTGDYIKSEVDLCVADYKTLESMNKLVKEKYLNYTTLAEAISNEMVDLNTSFDKLQPFLAQIDEIEKCLGVLEQSASKLDAYSKRLEAKYKQIAEKRF